MHASMLQLDMACMTGGIARAYYGQIPADIADPVRRRLPEALLRIIDRFNATDAITVQRFAGSIFGRLHFRGRIRHGF